MIDAEKEKSEIKIRAAEKTDAVSIEIILSTYFLDRDDIPYERFYVIENGSKIIGCAVFEKLKFETNTNWFYEIHTIAVMPAYKGKGYGKLLLNHMTSEIKRQISEEKEKEKISKFLYTRTTASDFFEHLGFEKRHIDKKRLWEECVFCDKYDRCNQTVLSKSINE